MYFLFFFLIRGNSKYHYYGIRVKPNSPLARIHDDTHVALRATPSTSSKRSLSSNTYDEEGRGRGVDGGSSNTEDSSALAAHQQYLGDVGDGLPDGPVIELNEPLPENIKKEQIIVFGSYYRSHSEVSLFYFVVYLFYFFYFFFSDLKCSVCNCEYDLTYAMLLELRIISFKKHLIYLAPFSSEKMSELCTETIVPNY